MKYTLQELKDMKGTSEPVRSALQAMSDEIEALRQGAERERYIKIMQMIDTHYSGSLDYQPPYVKAARQVLDVIDWPNA